MQFLISEAIGCMVIDHARRLHEGIADSRTDELEAALLEVPAQGVALDRSRRNLLRPAPPILLLLAADVLPDVRIKAADLFLYGEVRSRVGDGRRDLESVADDARVAQ